MGKLHKKQNLPLSRGLKYKLRLALYLMSILPLLTVIYTVTAYFSPEIGFRWEVITLVGVCLLIAILGFFVVKEVFDRILSISFEAKLIAAGDLNRQLYMDKEDEVSDLGYAINHLTDRIRMSMNELKTYSEKTTDINLEIQKRIIVLSNLLQISSLITQGAKIDEILKMTVEKSRFIAQSDVAYLLLREEGKEIFYIKIADGINSENLYKVKLDFDETGFNKLIRTNRFVLLDQESALPEKIKQVYSSDFNLKNTLAVPVYLKSKLVGMIGVGNGREQFIFKKDDIELLDIFAKQLSIAMENDILVHRIEKLEIKDALTGLYNETFIINRLREEIKRAIVYQRPCAYVILSMDDFSSYRQNFGLQQSEMVLKKIAVLIRDSVTEIDRVGRVGDEEFAIVLPEKNKRQALSMAEDIRRKIEFAFSEEQEQQRRLTASGAVSENPLDGISAEELINKARGMLSETKKRGKNHIAL